MTALMPESVPIGMAFPGSTVRSLLPDETANLPLTAGVARRNDFQLGRAAASDALRQLGFEAATVPRATTGAPEWPEGVIGSISHADGLALAAVARAEQLSALGIDIERVPDDTDALLHSDVLTKFEHAWCGSNGERAIQIFSAKEAIFKAIYPSCRRVVGYEEVELAATPDGFLASAVSKDPVLSRSLEELTVKSSIFEGWVQSCAFKRLTQPIPAGSGYEDATV